MIVGTSAMIATELDCIVNQYTDKFSNPMVMWGRYRRNWLRTTLPLSLQFHHVQMDGGHAAHFLEQLQQVINEIWHHTGSPCLCHPIAQGDECQSGYDTRGHIAHESPGIALLQHLHTLIGKRREGGKSATDARGQ